MDQVMPKFAPFALVEAFCSDSPGSGNPAGVVLLDEWIDDTTMQQIATTVNQAETAFVGPDETGKRIRWFTPNVEVDLCGHATLASAAFLASLGEGSSLIFQSRSGELSVVQFEDKFALDFPSRPAVPSDSQLVLALVPDAIAAFRNVDDWVVVFPDQKSVIDYQPEYEKIAALGLRGLAITAPGETTDFCVRFFAPQSGVPEDHATGSAQSYLVPLWAGDLGKNNLTSTQLSIRKGHFESELRGDRIIISGQSNLLITGEVKIGDKSRA
ncbi:MAG: PhzF family phenazine biosynthesis protein [Fimbriimonadaceae bacterium]